MVAKIFWSLFKIVLISYLIICLLVYLFQEKLLFFPEKLANNYQFSFDQAFQELRIPMKDGIHLSAIRFTTDSAKGLIFYLHGNAGSLSSWGEVASTYTSLGYDVLMVDYRGYGKSEGKIETEQQLFEDVQTVYDTAKRIYADDKMIVLGYSIGTGMASFVAANNHPQKLILQAPYYSMSDLAKEKFPFLPSFLLKYKLENFKWLKQCKAPVLIFHGTEDEVIYFGSSKKLEKEFKEQDKLIPLKGQSHNGITENKEYIEYMKNLLAK